MSEADGYGRKDKAMSKSTELVWVWGNCKRHCSEQSLLDGSKDEQKKTKNMQKISLQKAKEEIKKLFIEKGVKFKNDNQNDEKSTSFISNNTFFIDKRQMEREDVAAMLVNYFIGKQVENGGCILSPMTLLWTTIELYDKDNPRKIK